MHCLKKSSTLSIVAWRRIIRF